MRFCFISSVTLKSFEKRNANKWWQKFKTLLILDKHNFVYVSKIGKAYTHWILLALGSPVKWEYRKIYKSDVSRHVGNETSLIHSTANLVYTYKLTKMCIPCWPDISNLMEKLRSLLCSKKSLFHAKLSWVYIAMHSVLDTWQESCIEVYSIKRKTSFSYCYQTSVVDTHPFLNPRVKWDWDRESYEKEPTITCFFMVH